MKASDLTDPIIRRMSPAARKQLGVQTSDEAMAAFVVRNEMDIHRQIINLLNLRGIAFQRNRPDKPTGATLGWPDFTLALNGGQATAFEVKHGKNDLDPDQVKCIERMRRDGWNVHVVRSLDEVKQILDSKPPSIS